MEAKEDLDITVLIIIATLGMLILALFVIFMVLLYQKRFLANRNQVIALEKQHQEELLRAAIEIAEH